MKITVKLNDIEIIVDENEHIGDKQTSLKYNSDNVKGVMNTMTDNIIRLYNKYHNDSEFLEFDDIITKTVEK